jgi:hypothetical protein
MRAPLCTCVSAIRNAQVTFFVAYAYTVLLWLFSEYLYRNK